MKALHRKRKEIRKEHRINQSHASVPRYAIGREGRKLVFHYRWRRGMEVSGFGLQLSAVRLQIPEFQSFEFQVSRFN